ncbi:MAG: hypothetical protein V3S24_06940 [Candidatus Tectomicrobia bacterium]
MLIILGGFLNLLHIAYPMVLEILFGFGVGTAMVFAVLALRSHPGPAGLPHRLRSISWSKFRISGDLIPWFIILMATVFFAANLMPTSAFNFHDDFHKYLVTPIRMLQTGSLGGGPFEVVGHDHLGTQSYFQAFILTRFTPEYINGFDPIFCFLVAGLLLNDIGHKAEVHWFYRSVAMVVFVLINPQYVNISAVYSGVLFILALIYGAMLFADALGAPDTRTLSHASIPLGLLLASLISFKATFIPFALALGAMLALGFLLMSENRLRTAAAGGAALAAMAAILVPWSAISVNNYANIIALGFDRIGHKAEAGAQSVADWGRLGDLFLSRQETVFGGWLPGYNLAVLTVAVAALFSVYLIWCNREATVRRNMVIGLCLFAATVVAYLFNAYLFTVKSGRIDMTVRHFAPILIAAAPVTVLVLGRLFWRFHPTQPGPVAPASIGALTFLVALVLVGGVFVDAFFTRTAQIKNHRNALSFSVAKSKLYKGYNRLALSQNMRDQIAQIQSRTSRNETILAWIGAPFQLDFQRNRIMTLGSPRLIVRGVDQPFGGNVEAFRKLLDQAGVRYVFWEKKGYGIRGERWLRRRLNSPARKAIAKKYLDVIALFASLESKSKILYKNPGVVLFDIAQD